MTVTFALLLGLCSFAIGQRTIIGVVTDAENGDPLIGANVLVQGTSTGTITDIDGSYSLNVPEGATALVVSYTGYTDKTVELGSENVVDISLSAGQLLDEVVVVGYGSQSQKEITSAVVSVSEEEFNQGPINDPAQLLQGKVAGLQVYNRGGDPNNSSTIRMRGISTVGANVEPLIVVDGIIGASLDNIDPRDIASMDVLKDGSAAAIYGSRGSSGVIIITTKSGKGVADKGMQLSYSGQVAASSATRSVQVMDGAEFAAAGGTDLGSNTNWLDEVTQTGLTHVHNVSASGASGNSNYRISANIRDVSGILQNSGFDQINTRLNLSTKALNDKLSIDFNSSFTNRNSQLGFYEALRYGVVYNPTAPVLGENSIYPFNSPQFGGYFETLGLFDSFNPASIVNQNRNDGKRREFNYGATFGYSLLDNLTANFRLAQQSNTYSTKAYYPTTSLFRGNATSPTRKGRADLYDEASSFKLYEAYATHLSDFGNTDLSLTAGYSYQQNNFNNNFLSLGDFPNNDLDFINILEASQDLQNAGQIVALSNASPDEKIVAFFGRANATIDDAIFLNASIRREGSTKLGANNKWGLFPALGVGVDVNNYLDIPGIDRFKVRLGYGVTGALPQQSGLSVERRAVVNLPDGGVATEAVAAGNPDLKWEEKAETNLGIEIGTGRLSATLDLYNRDIKDFILERIIDAAANNGFDRRWENAGLLNTKGIELGLNYDVVSRSDFSYNTGVILSTYKTVLEEYVIDAEMRGNLGAPGQNGTNMIRVKVGDEVGNIWGPVFAGVADDGSPMFEDVNGDGVLNTAQGNALNEDVDFQVLGNGIPDLELGWTNTMTIGDWNINAFFRGAFGHSLVNTYRAFYEPRVSTQSSYNYVNTSKAVDGLTSAQFSSLYVEKADFFKLDNLTISRGISLGSNSPIKNLQVSLTGQNLFVITNYTGVSPEPSLVDAGTADNGGLAGDEDGDGFAELGGDVLSPGIDRRNNYFTARTVTLGVNFNF